MDGGGSDVCPSTGKGRVTADNASSIAATMAATTCQPPEQPEPVVAAAPATPSSAIARNAIGHSGSTAATTSPETTQIVLDGGAPAPPQRVVNLEGKACILHHLY